MSVFKQNVYIFLINIYCKLFAVPKFVTLTVLAILRCVRFAIKLAATNYLPTLACSLELPIYSTIRPRCFLLFLCHFGVTFTVKLFETQFNV